jgi:hypothetical protein
MALAVACGGSGERPPIAESSLPQLALTEEEGQAVIPDLTVYPSSPPVGMVPNDLFLEDGGTGDATLERTLVEQFHRQSGYHGEYFSESLGVVLELDLFATAKDARGALAALFDSLKTTTPDGSAVSRRRSESVGEESRSLRAGPDSGPHIDAVLFRRSNLVITVAVVTSDGRDAIQMARGLAGILDRKASAAAPTAR